MARLVLNDAEITDLLYGPGGPVYRHVAAFGTAVELLARELAPVETGALKSSIDKDQPIRTAGFLTMHVGAPVLADDRGRRVDYAFIVHEGHGVIVPRNAPELTFLWRKRGKYVRLRRVGATKEQPYLWDALVAANQTLPSADRFALTREAIRSGKFP